MFNKDFLIRILDALGRSELSDASNNAAQLYRSLNKGEPTPVLDTDETTLVLRTLCEVVMTNAMCANKIEILDIRLRRVKQLNHRARALLDGHSDAKAWLQDYETDYPNH